MKHIALAATAALLLTTATLADESWTSSLGEIVYEDEIDGVAIFSYPLPGRVGEFGKLYFPGLAGNYENRGTHAGYWIAPGDGGGCPAAMTGADGLTSKDWGQLLLVFHSPGYPASWTMINGVCFGPLSTSMVGNPTTPTN